MGFPFAALKLRFSPKKIKQKKKVNSKGNIIKIVQLAHGYTRYQESCTGMTEVGNTRLGVLGSPDVSGRSRDVIILKLCKDEISKHGSNKCD